MYDFAREKYQAEKHYIPSLGDIYDDAPEAEPELIVRPETDDDGRPRNNGKFQAWVAGTNIVKEGFASKREAEKWFNGLTEADIAKLAEEANA